jgi:hypothetical protein
MLISQNFSGMRWFKVLLVIFGLAKHHQSNIVPVIRPFEDPVSDGVSN